MRLNIMKKFIAVALFLAAIVALAGCATSKNKKTAEGTTEDVSEEQVIIPVELESSEYVKLGDYKGLTVNVEKRKITDEDVDESIQDTLEAYAEPKEIKDRDIVEKGDFVNIDYTCTIDGKKSEDYSDTDVDVKALNGEMDNYIGYGLGDEFKLEEKVIGAKVDDTVTMDFTFPEDYEDESVAGKKCTMEVLIRGIFEEEVPTLENYVKEYESGQSVEEYKKSVRKELEEQAEADAEDSATQKLWEQIVANATQLKDFSDDEIAKQKENVKIEVGEVSIYYDMEPEQFIKEMQGMTMDEYVVYSLKEQCVEDLLIKEENITVSDEEFEKEMKSVAEENGLESVDEVTDYYSKDEIRQSLIEKKLFDKLMSYTTVKTKEVVQKDDNDTVETAD
jgi:trigger factor